MSHTSQHIATANNLLLWNKKNLVSHADLQKSDISQFFAPRFRVKANGIDVEGNEDNYFDFLNGFRATIQSISYALEEFIVDADHVVIPMKAMIVRTNGTQQTFTAILILKFDENSKIVLWQEEYLETSNQQEA